MKNSNSKSWESYGTSMEIDGILKGFQMPLGGNGGYYVMGDVKEYIYIYLLILKTLIIITYYNLYFQDLSTNNVICGFTQKG